MLIAALALAADSCPATPPVLPPPFAGWQRGAAGMMASAASDDRRAMPLPLGQRVEVKLLSMASVDFDVAPEGTAPGREGGLLMLVVPAPGRYRVMLGGPAWIDLVAAGKPLASVGHDHGPACSGIRKMVDFQLAAGRYTLQLSGAQTATIAVMVVPVVNEGNQ
ncbi:MAG: hypothetical protein K2Y03_01015 [Sphingomonas sp.]|nr:hypothetical protein [Sphingomonas sp.]